MLKLVGRSAEFCDGISRRTCLTNAKGEVPITTPYRPENVLATIYDHLGIDSGQTFADFSGRPRYILEDREVIREIV